MYLNAAAHLYSVIQVTRSDAEATLNFHQTHVWWKAGISYHGNGCFMSEIFPKCAISVLWYTDACMMAIWLHDGDVIVVNIDDHSEENRMKIVVIDCMQVVVFEWFKGSAIWMFIPKHMCILHRAYTQLSLYMDTSMTLNLHTYVHTSYLHTLKPFWSSRQFGCLFPSQYEIADWPV